MGISTCSLDIKIYICNKGEKTGKTHKRLTKKEIKNKRPKITWIKRKRQEKLKLK